MSIEAMKQALEALEGFIPYLPLKDEAQCNRYDNAITSLRQAIAELESQEPVACDCNQGQVCHICDPITPPQRTWVGLTDEEIDKTHETQVWDARRSYARAIEAKLKEKNT